MSKYGQEINNILLDTNISETELAVIIAEADRVILEGRKPPEKIAELYLVKSLCLKKTQCLQKMGEYKESKAVIFKTLDLFNAMTKAIIQLGNSFKKEGKNAYAIFCYTEAFIHSGNIFEEEKYTTMAYLAIHKQYA
jgi:tetratricopeptide (TPR) repeat protein